MHTNNGSVTASAVQSEVMSPLWVYDTLMETIEPDLMSTNIQTLDEKYAHETPEKRTKRMERYVASFEIFDECLADLADEFDATAWAIMKEMNAVAVEESDKEDKNAITDIEQQLSNPRS